MRIGEATNPGPARRFALRQSLQELPTMSAGTLALESRVLNAFLSWCRSEISGVSCDELSDLVPTILVYLLRFFGDFDVPGSKSIEQL